MSGSLKNPSIVPFVYSLLLSVLFPLAVMAQPGDKGILYSTGQNLSGFSIKMGPDTSFQASSWDCFGVTTGKGYFSIEGKFITFHYEDQLIESSFAQVDTLELGGDSLRLTVQLFGTSSEDGLFPANLLLYDKDGQMIGGEELFMPITEVGLPASQFSTVTRIILDSTGYESLELPIYGAGSYEIMVEFTPDELFVKRLGKHTRKYQLESWTREKLVVKSLSGKKSVLKRH